MRRIRVLVATTLGVVFALLPFAASPAAAATKAEG
jgi:hypothetical protein